MEKLKMDRKWAIGKYEWMNGWMDRQNTHGHLKLTIYRYRVC